MRQLVRTHALTIGQPSQEGTSSELDGWRAAEEGEGDGEEEGQF